jgi:transposase
MERLAGLLPQAPLLHLETWQVDTTTAQVTLRVQSTQTRAHCPVCRCPTRRIHSRYRRTLADLPWAHSHVVLQLGVRKFCCPNGRCTRRSFTERLPSVVAPWARRTARLLAWLAHIAVALGGGSGRPAQPWPGRGRQSSHTPARAPPAAAPVRCESHCSRRGRFRAAETPALWHGPDRSGAAPAVWARAPRSLEPPLRPPVSR